MTINIHPIIVHFPIAFLFLYSLIILLPVQKWFKNISWKVSEQLLLLTGTLGIFVAQVSGSLAQKITRPSRQISEMHELFANTTMWFYLILIVIEFSPMIISFIQKKIHKDKKCFILPLLKRVHNILNRKWIIILSALLGVISLFLTGLLGGVMVYGISADPLAPFVLRMLGLV